MKYVPRHFERLNDRLLLAADLGTHSDTELPTAFGADVDPQYVIKHPPRLQPGNVPLVNTPDFDGFDQVEVIWQTQLIGEGTSDEFAVDYRRPQELEWLPASPNPTIDTGVATRVMHSALIDGLAWDSDYEYRVRHFRAGAVLATFQHRFHTRLRAGDSEAFSFVAYGDSATGSDDFPNVQRRINTIDPDFAVLLGDNYYTFGNHSEADVRFDPNLNPPAAEWNTTHVDYFSIGNHEMFVDNGQPARDLFSVPVPQAGFNAPVQPPAGEYAEHSYSFDYGDVHFVTFDTNPVDLLDAEARQTRLDGLIDYVVADIAASTAKWTIVYAHHPFLATEKAEQPGDVYFQMVVERFNAAGVDLFMVGHSHTYSWSYPLIGANDSNDDGVVDFEEVQLVRDNDRTYAEGDGLIQLVSGAGGGPLRCPASDEPVFGGVFALQPTVSKNCPDNALAGPLEFGFAQVDVTQRELVVSYISAETGQIVGDSDFDGQPDEDEPYFGQFRIVDNSEPSGDLNGDNRLDATDIDRLHLAIRKQEQDSRFDLDGNREINQHDVRFLIKAHLDIEFGDSNLDGVFDTRDLVKVFQAGQYEDSLEENSNWASGDWNGDGDFTSRDLVFLFQQTDLVLTATNESWNDALQADRDVTFLSDVAAAMDKRDKGRPTVDS